MAISPLPHGCWFHYSAVTAGTAAIALNSNVATRIEAIEARAVYDAVNAIDHFSRASYYYDYAGIAAGQSAATAAVAARKGDFAAIRTTYIPSTNISPTGTATDQGNPGPGIWRPVTALNADASGSTAPYTYAWKPLAATPSHPSSTSGHSATLAAGVEALRAFFGADEIVPGGAAQELTTFAWLIGTGRAGVATAARLRDLLAADSVNSGYFGGQ